MYHYTFGLRVSVSCSRRVNVSQNKLPCPSSWWWRNTSGGDGAPRWCVFNSFWSDEASWLRGMSYTRVWIHREVLDSKIHSVLVLGVLIGSVSNNTNTEYCQSYSLICIWMKIHQTESFVYLCEFICPLLRLCILARASTNTLSDIYTFSFAFIVQLVSTKEKDNLAVLQAFRPACRKPLSLYEHPSVWLCASDLFGRSEHLLG